MRVVDTDQFLTILKEHKLWLESDGKVGKKADLSDTNRLGGQFSFASLQYSDCHKMYAAWAHCLNANFRGADLRDADFQSADITAGTIFSGADCRGANFIGADIDIAQVEGMLIDSTTKGIDRLLNDKDYRDLKGVLIYNNDEKQSTDRKEVVAHENVSKSPTTKSVGSDVGESSNATRARKEVKIMANWGFNEGGSWINVDLSHIHEFGSEAAGGKGAFDVTLPAGTEVGGQKLGGYHTVINNPADASKSYVKMPDFKDGIPDKDFARIFLADKWSMDCTRRYEVGNTNAEGQFIGTGKYAEKTVTVSGADLREGIINAPAVVKARQAAEPAKSVEKGVKSPSLSEQAKGASHAAQGHTEPAERPAPAKSL